MWVRVPASQCNTSMATGCSSLDVVFLRLRDINETQRFGLLLPLKLFAFVAAGLSFGEPTWPTVDPTLSRDSVGPNAWIL